MKPNIHIMYIYKYTYIFDLFFKQHMDTNPNINYVILESALSDCHKLAYKQAHHCFHIKSIVLMGGWRLVLKLSTKFSHIKNSKVILL